MPDGQLAIDVGFFLHKESEYTLATLGRAGCDITLEANNISKHQATFEINPVSNLVMLWNHSKYQSTQILGGEHIFPLERERIRRVVVQKDVNTTFGMGGSERDLMPFDKVWHQELEEVQAKLNAHVIDTYAQEVDPRHIETMDDTEAAGPSQRVTRSHTRGSAKLTVRYLPCDTCRLVTSWDLEASVMFTKSRTSTRPRSWPLKY